jgi:hypothetical protein
MEAIPKLAFLITLINQLLCVQKLNFYMDRHDTLEIKYDLLLDKEQQINDLEAEAEGPIKIQQPTEPLAQDYKNIQLDFVSKPIENILDVKNKEHNIFYLYK